jgi:hypothetical protein
MRRLFSSGYLFEQHSFSLPFEQQRSFPAAPFGVRRRVLRSTTPEEGEWSADRRTLSFFLSRVRGATPALVRRGPVPVRPGPLSALHRGDFRPRTHAGVSGSGTRSRSDCPAPGRKCPGGRGPGLPRCGSRRSRGTPLLAPSAGRLRPLLSQDGESCTINSLRSQYLSSLRSRIRSQKPRSGRPRSLFRFDPHDPSPRRRRFAYRP